MQGQGAELLESAPVSSTRPHDQSLDQQMVEAAFVCDLLRVRDLLKQGASPDARDEEDRTPLFAAVLGGSIALVGLLIEAKADVNARDDEGNTPLGRAVFAARGRHEVVRLLRRSGARDDLPNAAGETPRQLAERLGENVFTSN